MTGLQNGLQEPGDDDERTTTYDCVSRMVTHERDVFLKELLQDEEMRGKQSKHNKFISALQEDRLSRTIFVKGAENVFKSENLKALRTFFKKKSRYGVEACWATNFGGLEENPIFDFHLPARVRFWDRRDAEKVLGCNSLIGSLKTKTIECDLGTIQQEGDKKKTVTIQPSELYHDILAGEDLTFVLPTAGFALGHWFPWEDDTFRAHNKVLDLQMKDQWIQENKTDLKPKLRFDFENRVIEIETDRKYDDNGDFSFDDITDSLIVPFTALYGKIELCCARGRDDCVTLTFSLRYPPRVETALPVKGIGHCLQLRDRSRCTKYNGIDADEFGKYLGYRFLVTKQLLEERLFDNRENLAYMQDYGLISRELFSTSQAKHIEAIFLENKNHESETQLLIDQIHSVSPRIGFQLRLLMDTGGVSAYHMIHSHNDEGLNLFQFIFKMLQMRPDASNKRSIIETLEVIAGANTRFPFKLFTRVYRAQMKKNVQLPTPRDCISVPRVILTPCRLAVQRFGNETGNSLVRRFIDDEGFSPESFLRLNVSDEDGEKLFYRDLTGPIESKLSRIIESGVIINGWKYELLGCSSSQLRQLSLWMVCPQHGWTIDNMRFALGDFSNCRTVSVYMMRFGQFLSSTRQYFKNEKFRVVEADDIACASKGGGRAMYHSDGNGLITRRAVNVLLQSYPNAPEDPHDVSIIQIRTGGVKGTVTVCKNSEGIGGDNIDVLVRKQTMVKFAAPYKSLDVCSIGRHAPYFLNRNVILLLCSHGIHEKVFIDMQREMIQDLDAMLSDRKKAHKVVKTIGVTDGVTRSALLHMLESSFCPSKEPFLLSCLVAIRAEQLAGLLDRARIFVPKGAVLMGGVDTSGALPEGCIFVQIQKEEDQHFEPLVGPVMVTKHPVMHRGDTRMLLAVNIPSLRHHRNVILFSRHGMRPEADKMAGSDLDGDEFAVTYDQRLFLSPWDKCRRNDDGSFSAIEKSNAAPLQKSKRDPYGDSHRQRPLVLTMKNISLDAIKLDRANTKPMDFTPPPPPRNPRKIPKECSKVTEALVAHFFEYAKNDSLGRIGMLWQDYAARFGAGCKECMELAQLHSVAVDYAKTGVAAFIPQKLGISYNTPRAHWREKLTVPSFHDNGIIGKLFDMAKAKEGTAMSVDASIASAGRLCVGQVLSIVDRSTPIAPFLEEIYDGEIVQALTPYGVVQKSAMEFARHLCICYETEIMTLMNLHGILGEGELATGSIQKYHKRHKRKQRDISEEIVQKRQSIQWVCRIQLFREVVRMTRRKTFNQVEDAETPEEASYGGQNEDLLKWVEEVAKGRTDKDFDKWSASKVREAAHHLTAACYVVAYSPYSQLPSRESKQLFFGFPWIFADIISEGMSGSLLSA